MAGRGRFGIDRFLFVIGVLAVLMIAFLGYVTVSLRHFGWFF